jgi:hypothetical protein
MSGSGSTKGPQNSDPVPAPKPPATTNGEQPIVATGMWIKVLTHSWRNSHEGDPAVKKTASKNAPS